jgi:hypothetical protein
MQVFDVNILKIFKAFGFDVLILSYSRLRSVIISWWEAERGSAGRFNMAVEWLSADLNYVKLSI